MLYRQKHILPSAPLQTPLLSFSVISLMTTFELVLPWNAMYCLDLVLVLEPVKGGEIAMTSLDLDWVLH